MMCQARIATFLGALLGLSGCLYVEGINAPPEVELEVTNAPQEIHIGTEVWVTANDTIDPDNDLLSYEWSVEHSGSPDSPHPPECDRYAEPWEFCFVAMAKVTYDVYVRVTDEHGAESLAQAEPIHVNNRPPLADCRIVTQPKPNNHFIVGRELWLYGGDATDLDPGDALFFHWEELLRPTNSSSAEFVAELCDEAGVPTEDLGDAVFLRVVPDVPGTYQFELRVADGPGADNLSSPCQLYFEVDGDQTPCIESTSPDHATGTLVFDRFETRRLEVTWVDDDLDPFPGGPQGEATFRWFLEEAPGAGFLEIPGYHFAHLDVDGAEFALGQRIRVRVQAEDRAEHDLSGCSVEQDTCAPVAGCDIWVTWEIEFR